MVVHAAASYKDPSNWGEDARTNAVGTANVVQAAERAGVSRFVYLQTALCYGLHPREQPISLAHALDPSALQLCDLEDGRRVVRSPERARLGLVSARERLRAAEPERTAADVLPSPQRGRSRSSSWTPGATSSTSTTWSMSRWRRSTAVGERAIYHVSSGSDVSIKDLFDAIVGAMGIEVDHEVEVRPRGPDDAPSILLDPSKTERDFRWAARTPLADGVRSAIDYYRRFGVAETFTHLRLTEADGD